MTIELSSTGRKNIRLEIPEDMAYFLPAASRSPQETVWDAQYDYFRYRFNEFKCKDFSVIRNYIYCKTDCRLCSQNANSSFLGLTSVQQGKVECTLSAGKDRRLWRKGFTNIIVCSGYKEECNYFKAGEQFGMTSLLVSSGFFLYLTERYPEFFEKPYHRLCEGETFFFTPENIPIPSSLAVALNDIETCRIMGNASRMYLEAKITECISIFIRETQGNTAASTSTLTASARDKIYEARDIICSEYLNPPSLHQLASRAGTNECSLKAGFKQVFGQTVFGYLYDYRMGIASRYLADTQKSIQEIAALAGYEYQSHFCTAFKKKFNMSPSEYRENL